MVRLYRSPLCIFLSAGLPSDSDVFSFPDFEFRKFQSSISLKAWLAFDRSDLVRLMEFEFTAIYFDPRFYLMLGIPSGIPNRNHAHSSNGSRELNIAIGLRNCSLDFVITN